MRASEAKAVARMRRALVCNRGGDGGDRPGYLACLTAAGLWIDDVDWITATDAQVMARTLASEPPEPPAGRGLDALILQKLSRRAGSARDRPAEAPGGAAAALEAPDT